MMVMVMVMVKKPIYPSSNKLILMITIASAEKNGGNTKKRMSQR
tara:strand:+ start:429 stop:560 length:132 start_codon:yes stop_codon:yes gene_type:complete